MKKVIIRKAPAPFSRGIPEASLSLPDLLREVYFEKESYDVLMAAYKSEDDRNNYFYTGYAVNESCVLVIDAHITLYRLHERTVNPNEEKVPWRYYCTSIYLGDSWWFDDSEIIDDLLSLNSVDFLLKYKGI